MRANTLVRYGLRPIRYGTHPHKTLAFDPITHKHCVIYWDTEDRDKILDIIRLSSYKNTLKLFSYDKIQDTHKDIQDETKDDFTTTTVAGDW